MTVIVSVVIYSSLSRLSQVRIAPGLSVCDRDPHTRTVKALPNAVERDQGVIDDPGETRSNRIGGSFLPKLAASKEKRGGFVGSSPAVAVACAIMCSNSARVISCITETSSFTALQTLATISYKERSRLPLLNNV
jgi:hypothetical protein